MRIFTITAPNEGQSRSWEGQTVRESFFDLQRTAYQLFAAIDDFESCNLDPESRTWLDDLRDRLTEIDNADFFIKRGGESGEYAD